MFRIPVLVAFTAALVVGCDSAETRRIEDTRMLLVGTWSHEVRRNGARIQRLVSLDGGGKFTDHIVLTGADGAVERKELAGEWSYDGTNLKRRYLQENGRQFSGGSMRYTTFPLVSVAGSELVVSDTLEGRQVSYRRVHADARPIAPPPP